MKDRPLFNNTLFTLLFIILIGNAVFLGGNREWIVHGTSLIGGLGFVLILVTQILQKEGTKIPVLPMLFAAALILWVEGVHYGYLDLGIVERIGHLIGEDLIENVVLAQDSPASFVAKIMTVTFIFYAAYLLGQDRERMKLIIFWVIAVQVIIALYALFSYFSGSEMILWFEKTAYQPDLTGTFINRNSFATFAGIGVILSVYWLVAHTKKIVISDDSFDKYFTSKLFSIITILLLLTCVANTHSRAGIISMILGLVVFGLLVMLKMRSRLRGFSLLIPVVAIVLGLFVVAPQVDDLEERISHTEEHYEDSRSIVYEDTLKAIQANPLIGFGAGSFLSLYKLIQSDKLLFMYFDKAHNTYLELAFELGVPVTLLMITVLLGLNILLLRSQSTLGYAVVSCWVLVAMHSLLDFSMQIPAVSILMFLISGLALGYINRPKKKQRKRSKRQLNMT